MSSRENHVKIDFSKLVKDYIKLKTRGERVVFLDNLCKVYPDYSNYPRKAFIRNLNYAIKCMGKGPSAIKKSSGRPCKYTSECIAALEFLLQIYNYPCADRFYTSIPEAIRVQQRDNNWKYSDKATTLLRHIPLGTLKLYTKRIAERNGVLRGISATRQSDIFRLVEIFCGSWRNKPIGYTQIDTVVHSGPRLEGDMAYTLTWVDVKSYWLVHRAQLNKSERVTLESIKEAEHRFPFKILGIHSDSGNEFVNTFAYNWCMERGVEFTRSRPSKKNDNCYVEERNRSSVRSYIGYERYDTPEAVVILNSLYDTLDDYLNFFQPTRKLVSKKKLTNGKWQYSYDIPRTPYQRVMEDETVSESIKKILKAKYETLNPELLLARIKALTIKLQQTQRELGYHFSSSTKPGRTK